MAQFVKIKHKATGAVGTCPIRALPYYEAKGHEAVDADEVARARKADGITAGDVKQQEGSAPFNPSDHSAKQVADHLAKLDVSTAEGQAEYDRIVSAEQAGQNRSSAIPS